MGYKDFMKWFFHNLSIRLIDAKIFALVEEVVKIVEKEPLSEQERMWQDLYEEKQIQQTVVDVVERREIRRIVRAVEKRLKEGNIK